jgi:hypothetical protein
VYTVTQNPGIFASNFIPLWAGVADGDAVQGGRVVEALNASGLVQPAGKEGVGAVTVTVTLTTTWFGLCA